MRIKTAYRNMVQQGAWNEVLQKPAGCSSFVAREGEITTTQQSSESPQLLPTTSSYLLQWPELVFQLWWSTT